MNPLVSIILPNYNHGLYLKQRIDSILKQSYTNFELIILDDKSTDNSVEIIESYRTHPKVSFVHINTKNSGSTFNQWDFGIKHAKGDLIWIAESDDYCDHDFLDICIPNFHDNPNCSIVFTSSYYVNENNEIIGSYSDIKGPLKKYRGRDFIKNKMAFGCAIWNASSAVFRKSSYNLIDSKYKSFKACGDKLFWINLAEKGDVIHINLFKNYFRQHQNKVSPRRFRDGTVLKEERMIYDYQIRKQYIRGFKRLFVLNLYRSKIQNGDFENPEIKQNLFRIWNLKTNRIYSAYLNVISWFYVSFYIHILRKKPL